MPDGTSLSLGVSLGASEDGKTLELGFGGSFGSSILPLDVSVSKVETKVAEFTPTFFIKLERFFNSGVDTIAPFQPSIIHEPSFNHDKPESQ